MKKWQIVGKQTTHTKQLTTKEIISLLLKNRGLKMKKEIEAFLNPPNPSIPSNLSCSDVGIDAKALTKALHRIKTAIADQESIVVYADYDADGITAGAIMWETLHGLGARVMPYIPHRVEEGYGLSKKGIDAVIEKYDPTLIITVDHGITAWEKVKYAKEKGIDVVVTDHHVLPKKLPDCTIVHTTQLCGAGVSWFVAKELMDSKRSHLAGQGETLKKFQEEFLGLAAIGTIADMVPLVGPNRAIVKYGLAAINATSRVGLRALIEDAGLTKGALTTFDVSHVLAPRLNAMGRLVHAMDALRLLCTKQEDKAMLLARQLGITNKERQQLTTDTTFHARELFSQSLRSHKSLKKLIFLSHESYNPGVIGLVAGKLVEEFYLPAIVLSKGEVVSKASARSIAGFNIIEAIRSCADILIDVGGHPMAAGFTIETKNLTLLQDRLEKLAEKQLDEEKLTRVLRIDTEIPLEYADESLWKALGDFPPYGFGNPEPVFATRGVMVEDARLVGAEGKHLKLRIRNNNLTISQFNNVSIDAIAFNFGNLYGELRPDRIIDIAYSLDMNHWNGNSRLQLKIKDIKL